MIIDQVASLTDVSIVAWHRRTAFAEAPAVTPMATTASSRSISSVVLYACGLPARAR